MKDSIAWARLIFYLGASILLLTEFYRLSLILLRLIIIAPSLMAVLQSVVHWGLLLGFSFLTLGIYHTLRADPPIISLEDYSVTDLNMWAKINTVICIILVIAILLPPTALINSDVLVIFSMIISVAWLVYYSLLVFWIIVYWKIVLKENRISNVVFNGRITIHIVLGICIALYWFLEIVSLILVQEALSNIDSVNITYIILLILFLFNQLLLFYKVTKFSYHIYG